MRKNLNVIAAYSIMMGLIILVGIFQSWNVALSIFNLCLISAVMTMGANIQWGYAGLINFGIMGYTALGGLAAVLISVDPVQEAWRAGGFDILMCLWLIIVMVLAIRFILKHFEKSKFRTYGIAAIIVAGIVIIRITAEPGIEAIEGVNPAKTGFLGGFGLPIIFSWIVGAFFAGGLAFIVGKVALGLRADYLAIATLLISEIVIAIIKHEDWLTRGVKNVIGLKRPAPYEVDLQTTEWFINLVERFNSGKLALISNLADRQAALNQLVIEGSSVFVKLCYSGLFLVIVIILLILTQKALYSPWGRMMRAIRDNEEAANAMGKNVVKQHLLIFILGSAIVGIAGAMLVTQDGLFTPGSYRPMRYTFLIWVMVIVGGSGNNFGAILGGFVVWFLWIEAAPIALFLINFFTAGIPETNALKAHLIESVPYFRFLMMGLGLLLIMRFRPKGILPEKIEIK
ncbi:branched-chain amino acid ABC transporter permease [Candidatus Pelagibacter bacterium]|jgi:branched-chain amino acid transport system permease protein|nr:branched-chain amino acid ABC transporter permease [Candidatus Pelagibacter bacterium]MDB2698658.1 branched-chain amino acid ABC transporter permease [Candidatus Pelagibacter bacterium]